jgi:hypothetical protein
MSVSIVSIEYVCLQSGESNLPNLAGAEAARLKLASCGKTQQGIFSFLFAFFSQIARFCPDLSYVLTMEEGTCLADRGPRAKKPKEADLPLRTAQFEPLFFPSVPLLLLPLFRFLDNPVVTFAVTLDASTL